MNLISILDISKTYGDKTLFEDLAFGIEDGQRIGVIGVNGTGKSTLLKVIAGIEPPDKGEVVRRTGIQVEYLPQNPAFDEHLTVLQSVFQGSTPILRLLGDYEQCLEEMSSDPENGPLQARLFQLQAQMDAQGAWDVEAEAKSILNRLGITNYSSIVANLSGGQRKRVAMARSLIRPADLLILDEPTNHIDSETVDWLESYLARSKAALLIITHDRYFLDRVVGRILELDRGKLYSYTGNYEKFLELKAERESQELASEDKRQNLLRRELAWLRRGARARTTKQKARVEFAEALSEQKVEKPLAQLEISLGSGRLGNKVIEINDISKSYEHRSFIRDFSVLIGPGERIGIVGPNGSGKSTLLNMIAGIVRPDSGSIDIGSTVRLGYFTQESVDMDETQRVHEYISEAAPTIRTTDGESISAGQMLERFLFPPAQQWTVIGKLSGGERRRLYLLRILAAEPNVLLLDEPTNDLDIQTLTILEDFLDHFPGTVITVSHDRYFLDRTVNRLIAFEDHRIREFTGMYSDYAARRREAMAMKKETVDSEVKANKEPMKEDLQSKKTPRKFTYHEQKEYDQIEEKIAVIEEKLSSLQAELAKGGSDYTRLQSLMAQQTELEDELNTTIERWTVLTELAEEIARSKG